jgi:hypothetical protein
MLQNQDNISPMILKLKWKILLATFLVFGIGIHRSAGCPKSAQAQRIKEVLFGLKIKRAGSSFFSEKVSATEQNND